MDKMTYQKPAQINGRNTHAAVDNGTYSTRKNVLTALEVYSEKYNIVGKIDIYEADSKTLVERKRTIKTIYDGYVFQLYAQYFAMKEMGYEIEKLRFYSVTDNKKYNIELPENNPIMFEKFESTLADIRCFSLEEFVQTNLDKCKNCIYEPACDRGVI